MKKNNERNTNMIDSSKQQALNNRDRHLQNATVLQMLTIRNCRIDV